MVFLIKKIRGFFNLDTELSILAKSMSWNVIGMSASKLLLLILSIYAARFLGSEDFGKWNFIRTSISIFGVFLGFGLSITPLRFIAKYINDNNRLEPLISLFLVVSALLGMVLTALVFFSKNLLGHYFQGYNGLENEIGIAAFFLFFTAMNSFFTGLLGGFNKFKLIAIANFFSSVLSVPVAIYLTTVFGLLGLIYGYLIYYFLQLLFLIYFSFFVTTERNISFSLKNDFTEEKEIFKSFSFPSLVSALIGGPAVWIAFAIVASMDNGFIMIGLYSAARIFQNSIIELSQQLNAPLISLISNKGKSSPILESVNFTVPLVLGTVMVFPLIFLPELVTWLFNKGGYNKETLTIVISLSLATTFIMIFKQAINRKIVTEERAWWGVYGNILWSIILIVSIFYLVNKFGVLGLAGSFLLASLLDLLISLPIYIKLKVIDKNIALSKGAIFSLLAVLIGFISVYIGLNFYIRVLLFIISSLMSILLLIKIKYRPVTL